jgi:hypothetical protein
MIKKEMTIGRQWTMKKLSCKSKRTELIKANEKVVSLLNHVNTKVYKQKQWINPSEWLSNYVYIACI